MHIMGLARSKEVIELPEFILDSFYKNGAKAAHNIIEILGYKVNRRVSRFRLFKNPENRRCAICGATPFKCVLVADMQHQGYATIHLVTKNTSGTPVILTLDHIKPLFKGGPRRLASNHQILCGPCNWGKEGKKL